MVSDMSERYPLGQNFMEGTLVSFGSSTKSIQQFLEELKWAKVDVLVDIRTYPSSRFSRFNRYELKRVLEANGIKYCWSGESLGGKPKGYLDSRGKAIYGKMALRTIFQDKIQRIIATQDRVGFMCSEGKPETCHRYKLLGHELLMSHGINMIHVTSVGNYTSQTELEKLYPVIW